MLDPLSPPQTYPPPDFVEPLAHDPAQLRSDEYDQLLRRDPQRYADVVQAISAFGVCVIDRDGRIASWNRGATRLSGWREREIVGRPYAQMFVNDGARDNAPQQSLDFARTHGHCRSEHRRRRPDGSHFLAECTLDVVRGAGGEIFGIVEVFQDITEQKARQSELYERATRDSLTRLFNRSHFLDIGAQEFERARRFAEPLSVALFDVDHYRKFNDSEGTDTGDRALVGVAQTLTAGLRRIDVIGRLGGDDFAVLLPRCDKGPALEIAQRLRLQVSENRISTDGPHHASVQVSGGVAAMRPLTRDFGELMRHADAALFKAKREGRNAVRAWFE
ncbi:sensor domain-containing diguanylate cyclase [Solimonas terrae]|uniref:Sensor domain-containing diguanylate cyclase n=1 Tax=Solimonas terrae TaxID=1396819 RepID=A0A6M2BVH5_9GAMM|nr:diguanylate cyclase [Solimonas terrae]NGY06394.1 sensor domain-containing diguanylate cyclase [Solimonas terrae]